jgi:hypothetical protein
VTRASSRTQPRQQPRALETLAEPAELTQTSGTVPPNTSPRVPKKVRFALPEVSSEGSEQEYVVDRVVDAQMNDKGVVLYQFRWFGYNPSEDTWEDKVDIPVHFIRRYWHLKGLTTLHGESTLH